MPYELPKLVPQSFSNRIEPVLHVKQTEASREEQSWQLRFVQTEAPDCASTQGYMVPSWELLVANGRPDLGSYANRAAPACENTMVRVIKVVQSTNVWRRMGGNTLAP
jgi:hypothetical protein